MTINAAFLGGSYETIIATDRMVLDYISGGLSGVVVGPVGSDYDRGFRIDPGPGHTVIANYGKAFLAGRQNDLTQGSYMAWAGVEHTVGLPLPKTQPFIATAVLRVADSGYGTIAGDLGGRIDIIEGTMSNTPVPVSDITISSKNVYGGWTRLAEIRINPADTGAIPAGQITDVRVGLASRAGDPILCYSYARPDPAVGMQIFERDTKHLRIHNGQISPNNHWIFVAGKAKFEATSTPGFAVPSQNDSWGTGQLIKDVGKSIYGDFVSIDSEFLVFAEPGVYQVEMYVSWVQGSPPVPLVLNNRWFADLFERGAADPQPNPAVDTPYARSVGTSDGSTTVTATITASLPGHRVWGRLWQSSGNSQGVFVRTRITRQPG